jgi:dienelactone hydrolase
MRIQTRNITTFFFITFDPDCMQEVEGGACSSSEGGISAPDGSRTVEKVVEVPRALDPHLMDKLRQEIEEEVRAEVKAAAHGMAREPDPQQLAQVGICLGGGTLKRACG